MTPVPGPWRRFAGAVFAVARDLLAHGLGSLGAGRSKGVTCGLAHATDPPGTGRRTGVPYGSAHATDPRGTGRRMGVPCGFRMGVPNGAVPHEAAGVPCGAVGVPYGAPGAVGVPYEAVPYEAVPYEAVGVPYGAPPCGAPEAVGVPYGPYGAVASTFVPPADRGPLGHAADPPGARRRKGVPSGAILLLLMLTAGCGAEPDEAEHPGKAVYQRYCYACHQAGIADAPKLGDKEAWAERLQKTRAELVRNVKIGMPPGMPPRAGCASCSDEDLEAAVDFIVLRVQ